MHSALSRENRTNLSFYQSVCVLPFMICSVNTTRHYDMENCLNVDPAQVKETGHMSQEPGDSSFSGVVTS